MHYEFNDVYCVDSYEGIKKIPEKSIDLIVTDPPYEMCANGGGGCFGLEKRKYHFEVSKNESINCGITDELLEEMCRVLKKVNIYLWCNKNQLSQYLNFFEKRGCNTDVLVWCKTNPIPMCRNKYVSDLEYCIFAKEKGVGLNGTFETKRKWYATPLNVITNSSEESDVIFDPFVGSGTTCVAAKNLGRKYLGFEINPKWTKIAKDRLKNVQANGQTTMFTN